MSFPPLSGHAGIERETIQSEIVELHAQLVLAKEMVEETQRALTVQQRRVDTLRREVSVREQTLSICGTLPLDVLGLIAIALVDVDPYGIWSFRSVCRAWGEAAIWTPRAWSKVVLEKPRAAEQTKAWVHRAKAVPIELAVTHTEAMHSGLRDVLVGRRVHKLHTSAGLLKTDTYDSVEFGGLDTLSVHSYSQEETGPLLDRLLSFTTPPAALRHLNVRRMIANPYPMTLPHLKSLHLTLSTLWLADFAILVQSLSGTLQDLHLQQCNVLPGRRGWGNTFVQASPITLPHLNDLAIITGSDQTEVWGHRFHQHETLLNLITSSKLKQITCSANLLDEARNKFEGIVEAVGVVLIHGGNDGRETFEKVYGWKNLQKLQLIGPTATLAKVLATLEDASLKLRTEVKELTFLVEVSEEFREKSGLAALMNMVETCTEHLRELGRSEVGCAIKRRSMAGYGIPWCD